MSTVDCASTAKSGPRRNEIRNLLAPQQASRNDGLDRLTLLFAMDKIVVRKVEEHSKIIILLVKPTVNILG